MYCTVLCYIIIACRGNAKTHVQYEAEYRSQSHFPYENQASTNYDSETSNNNDEEEPIVPIEDGSVSNDNVVNLPNNTDSYIRNQTKACLNSKIR